MSDLQLLISPKVIQLILCISIAGQVVLPQDVSGFGRIHKLGKLTLNAKTVTVSGFSAGSSMATQFHVAHSSLLRGAALFSQAFYRCGPNSLIEFGIRCSKTGLGLLPYNVHAAIQDAKLYEDQGLIDPLTSLRQQKVFIWTGILDEYLSPEIVVQNKRFYEEFVLNPTENIKLVTENAKHLFPTDNFGAGCTENAEHNLYLGNCNYSGAAHSLKFLLGDLISIPSKGTTEAQFDPNQLKLFDQTEFYRGTGNISEIGMGTLGHIYIPKVCEDSQIQCHLHFNFHGCNEWPLELARPYVLHSGFLPMAELNRIVVVFPLTTSIPTNYNGCWDLFSYTGSDFGASILPENQPFYHFELIVCFIPETSDKKWEADSSHLWNSSTTATRKEVLTRLPNPPKHSWRRFISYTSISENGCNLLILKLGNVKF